MNHRMTIAQICGAVESPLFDRKSARIDAKALAVHLIAFANADGGVIAVGVEDDGTITGIDSYAENINELLRAPFDFCKPSVRVETERLSCTNRNGKPDHILLIEVLQSSDLHAIQADEVFFRGGDKSKKLNFEERLQLMYAMGTRYFEDTPVPDAGLDDLDLGFVREFTSRIGYRKSPEEYLRENKEFLSERSGKEEVSAAAMLLVAGAVAGEVTVRNISMLSKQADTAVCTALVRAGAAVINEADSVTAISRPLHGFEFDATNCPDLFPALAALAAAADGVSTIRGTSRLLHKESNRAEAIREEYAKVGIEVDISEEDVMRIRGGKIRPARVSSHDDHRMAMSMAVSALRCDGQITIENAECVAKSYPGFFEDLEKIRV